MKIMFVNWFSSEQRYFCELRNNSSPIFSHTDSNTSIIAISSHRDQRLCESFNICLNNAKAFHKPGVVPRLIPGLAARHSLGERYQEYFFFSCLLNISFLPFPSLPSISCISLFSPCCSPHYMLHLL